MEKGRKTQDEELREECSSEFVCGPEAFPPDKEVSCPGCPASLLCICGIGFPTDMSVDYAREYLHAETALTLTLYRPIHYPFNSQGHFDAFDSRDKIKFLFPGILQCPTMEKGFDYWKGVPK
jgi:hypothetical protein